MPAGAKDKTSANIKELQLAYKRDRYYTLKRKYLLLTAQLREFCKTGRNKSGFIIDQEINALIHMYCLLTEQSVCQETMQQKTLE